MKVAFRLLAALAALATLSALPWAAQAQTQTQAAGGALPPAALARATALAVELARREAPAGARIEAEPGPADPRLRLAACADITALELPGMRRWGLTRVGLSCRSGPVHWRITLPITVRVWAPARVALRALPSAEALDAGQFTVAVVDWGADRSPPLPPDTPLAERRLARPLLAGAPLREADLRVRQWFVAGDTVRVRAQGQGFAISADAEALSAGLEGRPARLRSANGRVFNATPVGERLAELQL